MKPNNNTIKLNYGQGCLDLLAGEEAKVVLPQELPPAGSGEVERSLDQAVGRRLEDFAGARSASILVSDITRPAPSHLMLPPLVKRIRELGIRSLFVVFALGTHRRMTVAEEEYLLKDCICLPHVQHDSKGCVPLGWTERELRWRFWRRSPPLT